jgi:hypothetical protein
VAVTLVSEARSQIVESGEGTGDFASQVRWPYPSAVQHRSPTSDDDNGAWIDAPLDAGFNDLIQRSELPGRSRKVRRGSREEGEETEREKS